ncbi:MAG: SH3 domain-containing protein [Oscillospiraceae bacterium]|nr:SH3 domain-containing protein [Oscillospiraceae bacterium]
MSKKLISFTLSLILIICLFSSPVEALAADSGSKAGAVTTSSTSLNVRKSASSSSSVVAALPKGSYVTLMSKTGSWWRVEYAKGQYGYCHASYITVVQGTPATVNVSYGSLNVRRGAGTNYSRIGTLSKGETVILLSSSGSWSRILYNGTKTGYVSSVYLKTAASGGYSAISLNVPSYKQTDTRWANTYIGSSGKTIAQIGCATTAIAMMESYRTGTTVYPNAMAKKLSYTSSGSVYWPDHYTVVTSSSGYLDVIYKKLSEGKPVLFGAKNAWGGQHWVVITGFTGGSLTAANFIINDPGSNSRTTLQSFLNSYPTFYKFFYY